MDAARKLNVSPRKFWFVGRCMLDCCFTLSVDETSEPNDLCIICCGVSHYCYRSCSFSAIDHGPKPRPCSKSLFRT